MASSKTSVPTSIPLLAPPFAHSLQAAPQTKPVAKVEAAPPNPFNAAVKRIGMVSVGALGLAAIGMCAPPVFMTSVTTFALASIVGYQVVWGVQPALHSPLMSVTNAVSGIVAVGGLVLMGGGFLPSTLSQFIAAASVLIASINISGGVCHSLVFQSDSI